MIGGIDFSAPISFTNFIVSNNRVLSEVLTAVNLGYDKCQGRVSQKAHHMVYVVFTLPVSLCTSQPTNATIGNYQPVSVLLDDGDGENEVCHY
jgi:hypothetical protein